MRLHVPCLTQSESRGGECSEFVIRHRVPIETAKGYFVECRYRFILLVDTPVQLAAKVTNKEITAFEDYGH